MSGPQDSERSDIRVAIIDDNRYTREHMRDELARCPDIVIVVAMDQDAALRWPLDGWQDVDVAIVDVFDEAAPLETGTDLYSGISVLDHLRALPIRTVALTAHRYHPLVEQRIFESGADELYYCWEINDFQLLLSAVRRADLTRAPRPVAPQVLRRHGADRAHLNVAVSLYESSVLHGRLGERTTHRALNVSRRTIDAFTERIRRTGYVAPPPPNTTNVRLMARWPQVRDYMLVLLGRKDAPPSSTDGQDELWRQG